MKLNKVILRPIVTEQSMKRTAEGDYCFEVAKNANKQQIREAVEKAFKVTVLGVKTLKRPGKRYKVGRFRQGKTRSDLKKAIVRLKKDDKIEVFESVSE